MPPLTWMLLSADVEKLKKLILHNPYILTLPEVGDVKDDIIPRNVQQFYVSYPFVFLRQFLSDFSILGLRFSKLLCIGELLLSFILFPDLFEN